MKRIIIRFLSIFTGLTLLLSSSIPVFAHDFDFDHNYGGYCSRGGIDCRIAVWSFDVNSFYASSSGHFITNRATGSVYTGVQAGGVWADNTGTNSSSSLFYGDGQYAEIWFYNITYANASCQYNQIGYGSTSGSDSQTSWSLSVSTSSASSYGSTNYLYTGNVYCYTDVDYTTNSTTAYNSNNLSTIGNGYAAGITFSDLMPIHLNIVDKVQNGTGMKTGYEDPAHWSLIVATDHAESFGYVDSGSISAIHCGVIVNDIFTETTVANSNYLSRFGNATWAEIYI